MREIKFRGLLNNRVWYYATFDDDTADDTEWRHFWSLVGNGIDKKTVGQHIGIKDSHDKEGYAGDVVKIFGRLFLITDAAAHGFFLNLVKDWDGIEPRAEQEDIGLLRFGNIIGDIYSNPKLLEREGTKE